MTARGRTSAGDLLRQWREGRRLSQRGLALEAGVSSRHLSFVETGRAQPGRDFLLDVARALDVPLRAWNEFLTAAGFASIYRETELAAPEMTQVRRAVAFDAMMTWHQVAKREGPRWPARLARRSTSSQRYIGP